MLGFTPAPRQGSEVARKTKGTSKKTGTKTGGSTSFNFGANADPLAKRYPKKIYELSDLPIKQYKTFSNIKKAIRDNAKQLDEKLLQPGEKLAVRIERSKDKGGNRKYNSSRKIFDSFEEIAHYLGASNSLDRNNELLGHIQIIKFKNLYNSQVWKADEDIKAGKRMLKRAEKKERQLKAHKATKAENKVLRSQLRDAEDQRKRAEKQLREALTTLRAAKRGIKSTQKRKPQPGGRKKK